jgi:predicted membrane protein (TIGR00267 family)
VWVRLNNNIIQKLKKRLQKYVRYLQITEADEILRRYFVINSFDGLLVVMGIIMGTYVGGVRDPRILISATIGAAVAMGVSGFFGVYMSEKAERRLDMEEAKEERGYDRETYEYAIRHVPVWAGIVDGLSPVFAIVIAVSPFVLTRYGALPYTTAMGFSLLLILAMLFALGLFLGRISKGRAIVSGIKMVAVGVATALLSFLFSGI